ncbi:DUF4871 domain-containing protein [Peribacillus psychrosaccharolyticus]|uniref:DUF4871 domain-containing protein n=1 Tax=Peribacillus psychrosaccharolyticus TaxID=1407 RepID=UPI003D26BCA7
MFRKSKYMILAALMLVVLSACSSNKTIEEEENSKPEVSSTFSIPVTFEEEGKKGEYILVGEKEKLAFQIDSRAEDETIESIESSPIVANKPDKYMWYLWGENLSSKPFKVIGINTDTKQEVVIFNDKVLGSELNGADAHTPSTMEFPTAGIWNLDAYVGEELFENIVVEVK